MERKWGSIEAAALETASSGSGSVEATRFVSLASVFIELLVACLSSRSAFISEQSDVLADFGGAGGVLKVPVEAARGWVRALLSTPEQLQAQDNATLIHWMKVCFSRLACVLRSAADTTDRTLCLGGPTAYLP